jgi:hypothetical protein
VIPLERVRCPSAFLQLHTNQQQEEEVVVVVVEGTRR